jgi:TetR/AcrR family transcriptional regulator, cholesterol catabolism regulator
MPMKTNPEELQLHSRSAVAISSVSKAPLSYDDLPPKQKLRWDRILDVTYALVTSRDTNIEVRDIAEAAGLAMGTVYRYFPSKEILFAEMYYRWRERLEQAIDDDASGKKTGAERVTILLTRTLELIEKYPQFGDLAAAVRYSRNPAIVQRRWKMEARTARIIKRMLTDVRVEDLDGIVWLLSSSFIFAVDGWRAGDITIREVHAKLNETVRLLFGKNKA